MGNVLAILAGGGLVFVAVAGLLARHVYLTLPETLPREETALSPRGYEAVRLGLVAGGTVGGLGAVVAVVDTVATVAATGPGTSETLAGLAVAIPEWASSSVLVVGAAVLAASGLFTLASQLRAWLDSRDEAA
jgi:hypothetical protein